MSDRGHSWTAAQWVGSPSYPSRDVSSGTEDQWGAASGRCMGQCAFRGTPRSEMAEAGRGSLGDSFVTPPPSTSERFSFLRVEGGSQGGFMLPTRFNEQGVLEPVLTEAQRANCEGALKLLLDKTRDAEGRKRLLSEFQALQSDVQALGKAYSVAEQSANEKKNRYMNVLPFDDSRVVLVKQGGLSSSSSANYINASHVVDDAVDGLPRYIATQAPLKATVQDFWEMVFQQHSPAVIMISRHEDDHRETQALYFPLNVGESAVFGRIRVTNRSVERCTNPITLRTYDLQDTLNLEPPFSVVHFEYLAWPDHGVPRSTSPVREILRNLYQFPKDAGPFVVHCSAGIGRTGTFIVISSTVNRILNGDLTAVDIQNTVAQFRNFRAGLVQTSEQYRFIYQAVIDELQDLASKDCQNPASQGSFPAPYRVPWSSESNPGHRL